MNPIPFLGFTDPISSCSHLLAAVAFFIGAFLLCHRGRGNVARVTSLIVFSLSLVFLFSMSGVFHLLERGGNARAVLQKLDHAGIWVLIAGTFTPIHTILFRGSWRWLILTLVWTLAITGLVLEIVFFSSFPEWLLLSFFLGLGWLGALSGFKFMRMFKDPSIKFFIAGGLSYSIGAVIDFARWPNIIPGVIGPHEIFHFFVILGAYSHWYFVYRWSAHPVANKILFHVHIYPTKHVVATAIGESLRLEASSVEEMKQMIKKRVSEKYHSTIQPSIRLRYFQEEHL
jgi:channel protein (hemolysin III family)